MARQASAPQQIADELLAADRAFAAASAKTDLISGISAMFATDVAMPAPTGIAYGSQKATEALRSNPANTGARAEWTPVRVALNVSRATCRPPLIWKSILAEITVCEYRAPI